MSGGEISYNDGSGIYNSNAGVQISGGIIRGNRSDYGGGIDVQGAYGSYVIMTGGTIEYNTAYYGGGGIACGGSVNISGGSIKDNYIEYSGGGISCVGGVWLNNCSITGDIADVCGGGVFSQWGDVYVGNNVYYNNQRELYQTDDDITSRTGG